MYYEDFFVELTYGGVLQWCRTLDVSWDRRMRYYNDIVLTWLEPVCKTAWVLRLIYYRVRTSQRLKAQIVQPRRLFHTVGVMSRSRGEHHKYSKRWRNANS